ncbi:MAG: AraC family transcriptional regulator [Parabacteroides sp.]|nr:AraC family transcriptional regulator [Parabacteroides sp.]
MEEPKENNDFLKQYIDIVKANISNPELDVSVIYEALNMSRTNFYRKVKAVTGLSPIELIKNIRLEAGAKLLKESDMNISEIAQHVGFSSRSYFARSFKAVYGMSPTEYQETESQNSSK